MNKIFDNLKIKTKLIILFIVIKVIPVLIIATIAIYGINTLYYFFHESSINIKKTAKDVVTSTAEIAIKDSILALDRKSQTSIEMLSSQIAQKVANFLYERDNDIRYLSTINPNEKEYTNFLKIKQREVLHVNKDDYIYNDKKSSWENKVIYEEKVHKKADLKDNQREFNRVDTKIFPTIMIPIYKELSFFDLEGKEKIKISSISLEKKDISKKKNTFLKAEDYFEHVVNLKENEIYVSNVIGEYVPSKIIGIYTKEKAKKTNIPFEPDNSAYAGKENPKGKEFEGIIRFVTPIFQNNKKIGYISLALDHKHIMEFTDTIDPLSHSKNLIPDANKGNYAFMWDYEGRNISHARDYFIVGFNKEGKRVNPWISKDLNEKFINSKKDNLNDFLRNYPVFENQSLDKKPNISQIKKGELGLDCRYLNFAPQCQGWMQLTQNGGTGSFIIFWSNVWKLTTAATIPYYTGQYGSTPRGFGFITIGANVAEFHKAAQKTKDRLDVILFEKLHEIDVFVEEMEEKVKKETTIILNELTYSTAFMIILMILIAIWLSNHLRNRLNKLLIGAKEFANNNLSHKIIEKSNDEIGDLAKSFNDMSTSLQRLMENEKELNASLEKKVIERTKQLSILNEKIQEDLEIKTQQEETLKIFANIFSNTIEAISITDPKGKILQINNAFTNITQYTEKEILGKDINFLSSKRHGKKYFESMWETINANKIWQNEIWNKKKDGTTYPALLSILPISNQNGEITHFVGIQYDITMLKKNEAKLHEQAYYDSLTKLANRSLGYERLQHALETAKEQQNKVAVLFLDLDKFKLINDTMGHDTGDLLLKEVAQRLTLACSSHNTVCRLGGDEFLIILENIQKYDEAIFVIENIIKQISKPFYILNNTLFTSTSIGVTFYPDDGEDKQTLLKNADIAMYRAKSNGKNTFEIFTKELSDQLKSLVQLEEELQQAIEKKQFFMVYQPIFDIETSEIVGFEALMRWEKDGVQYPPSKFMDTLENSKLIIKASYSVLDDTLNFINKLNQKLNKNFFVSINVSSVQFECKNFYKKLVQSVESSGLRPQNICLEVTETIFIHKIEEVSYKLQKIKELGFFIALDDFGTGYSSLKYLKDLPIDKLKLDKSFIQGLPDSKGDSAIVNAISSLGENLSLNIIAEGVEEQEQLDYLKKETNCKLIQGYLLSKPKTKDEIESMFL